MTEELAELTPPTAEELAAAEASVDDGWEWSIVEIFGHRRHAGRTREEEKFGAKLLRIDVPKKGDPIANGWETHYYGGASIFSFTPTDEATVMKINRPYESAHAYRLPAPGSPDDRVDEDEEF